MISFDDKVKRSSGVVPSDRYLFLVASMKEDRRDTEKEDDVQVIEVGLVISEGEFENKKLRRTFYLNSDTGRTMFKAFLDAANPAVFADQDELDEIDEDDVIGQHLYISLTVTELRNGREINDWDGWESAFQSVQEVEGGKKSKPKKDKKSKKGTKPKKDKKSKKASEPEPTPDDDDDDDEWD